MLQISTVCTEVLITIIEEICRLQNYGCFMAVTMANKAELGNISWVIQSVLGGNVNILGGHSMAILSKIYIRTYVLFRTVSEVELWMLLPA
jgi:hypothetical protein